MSDAGERHRPPGTKGCLASAAGLAVLAVISPFALVIQSWRRWRRGDDIRVALEVTPWSDGPAGRSQRIDATMNVPLRDEAGFRRRVTDAVVRIAEAVRRPDDVYNMVYRMPLDEEALILAVGPQLQGLGERFFLTLNQGVVEGRTIVWLTLARDAPLASVVDAFTCDPEAEGQLESLLAAPGARWTMASEWARVGPSLVIRLIFVVPASAQSVVKDRLTALSA